MVCGVVGGQMWQDTHKKRDAIVSFFGITENEIAAVGDEKIPELVLEQVTLTGLWR